MDYRGKLFVSLTVLVTLPGLIQANEDSVTHPLNRSANPTPPNIVICLPDHQTIRGDVADYLWEVQRFDRELGEILARLEAMGELDNTLIVVSGDNGMPFPRCKATLYDQGTRVPLAIRWGAKIKGGRQVSDFVSLCDLAPTFLEAAGLQPTPPMTGRSLMPLLESDQSGRIVPARNFVLTGMEKHVYPYPARASRTDNFLYIRNFGPDQWSTGEVDGEEPIYDFADQPWPTEPGAFSFNIDPSPSKQFLRLHRNDAAVREFAKLAFGRRPEIELYDLRSDPHQLHNVAGDANYAATQLPHQRQLNAELIKSDDPRMRVPGYTNHEINGWPVRISEALVKDQPAATERALELLAEQLKMVTELLPAEPLAFAKTVPIWFSPAYDGVRPTGEYHPGAGWLKSQGRRPELHQCVEFTNIPEFEKEIKRMPVLVLHELAHAYHDQVLGFDHPEIKAAFQKAKASGIYESILRSNGNTERAYAISNPNEYFAENSEAFFGTNDFFPFERSQLKRHDPEMHDLLQRLWKVDRP